MKILDKIVEDKKAELKNLSSKVPISLLEKKGLFSRKCTSLKKSILTISSPIIPPNGLDAANKKRKTNFFK